MNRPAAQTKAPEQTPAIANGRLQRKCACGSYTVAGGQCTDCGKSPLPGRGHSQAMAGAPISLARGAMMQRKLRIGASNDALELEADRVAEQVMSGSGGAKVSSAPPRIQRYGGGTESAQAPASVERVLGGSGSSLEPRLRQEMEQSFGRDFSRVRLHLGGEAERSAREVNARAYTVGNHIVFGAGSYSGAEGRRLLAHELTHVVQQSGQPASAPTTIQRKARTEPAEISDKRLLSKLQQEHGGAEEKLPLTPAVLAWVAALRSGEVKPDEADPAAPAKKDSLQEYPERRHEGEAFIWGDVDLRAVDASDVNQGSIGDCYFMALLAAIAEVRPDVIEQMVKPNADGSFTVSFFAPDGKRVQQIVWPDFPTFDRGEPAYAKMGDQSEVYGRELWPMLIEKAWMQVRGSWAKIEGGQNDPKQHAIAMTGSVREDYSLPGKLSDDALFDRMAKSYLGKQPVTVFSPTDKDANQKKANKNGVIINHAYALWNVHAENQTVDLYNPHGPDSDHRMGTSMAFLKANFRSVVFYKIKAAEVSAAKDGPSKEEQLGADAIPRQILKDSGYDQLVANFQTDLASNSSPFMARVTVKEFGDKLWEKSKQRAQDATKADTDDRPLYWARLAAASFIRAFAPTSYKLTPAEKQGLLEVLEASSRGRTSIDFTGAAAGGARRILVSGFDPFGLRSFGKRKANPSGAAVLALDGQTIAAAGSGRDGRVEGVIFPVRYADFDRGIVETTFRPYLQDRSKKVDMIMTISQGGSTLDPSAPEAKQSEAFELERFAGRHRAPSGKDNDEADPVGATGLKEGKRLGKGKDFLESTLPRTAMSGRGETEAEARKEQSSNGEDVGSGGGFLSNEVFYRTRLLNPDEKSPVPIGHLHVPFQPAPTDTAASESEHTRLRDKIIGWVKKLIANALKSMGI